MYKNESDKSIEATFSFPAGESRTVSDLKIFVDDRQFVLKMQEKQKAKEKYDDAIAAGKAAALAQETNDDLTTLSIGTVLADQTVTISLSYLEFVTRNGQSF